MIILNFVLKNSIQEGYFIEIDDYFDFSIGKISEIYLGRELIVTYGISICRRAPKGKRKVWTNESKPNKNNEYILQVVPYK